MELTNGAKDQHFVSQTEQELNAFNPGASPANQRIFSFSVKDRGSYSIALDSTQGRRIVSNLSLYDLFSFDVRDRRSDRKNFESLFGQYESGIKKNTESLITKLAAGTADVKSEILGIFVPKILNFLRNPYSVKKVLNTFGGVSGYRPTDANLLREYDAVIAGKKPHQEYLCSELGISATEYQAWLSALFMLLHRPEASEPNMLERTVKGLHEDPSHLVSVFVYRYTGEDSDKRCLLSDRGYSSPVPQGAHLAFSFNLCSNAFISYVFTNIDEAAPESTDPRIIAAFKRLPRNVTVFPRENDLLALSAYNRNVVFQCHSKVFCSSRAVYGVRVSPA